MKNDLILTMIYLSFWFILVGKVNAEIIIFGSIISVGILISKKKMQGGINKKCKINFILFKKAVGYLYILCFEIIKANLQVAMIVLKPRLEITPTMVSIDVKLKSKAAKVILANSISLTPGTLTVQVEDKSLLIHSLLEDYVKDLYNSKFERILLEIEEILC